MSSPHAEIAILARRCEWLMSDAAFALGWRRYSSAQCRDAAAALEEFATALRQHAETLPAGELPGHEPNGRTTPVEGDGDA
ncbi:hypothetical protein SAMN04487905_1025 [Actinopolyspora xinjiangensis]|uniref:Uncharacterized protein n=1 Tax=Actinopolyspora xinjiangensis TaxID=405564 RepID=A0A1H0PZ05_9ACTN|nr:hypothetical protein [Actinopolyspora xinjiangensis]SDP10372.1 hypothetical protein SAMN04487905_1025 [Actinopolyspora xinjiangensis]